ncbi:MAG: hypothetical protein ACRD1E_10390 [Terriglobales bacterium]
MRFWSARWRHGLSPPERRPDSSDLRPAYDELLKRVVVLCHCGLLEMQDQGQVYVQGASHLASVLAGGQLEAMLESLNQKERWLQLLADAGADAWVEWNGGGVRVRVGLEDEARLSLIAADCGRGTLAILGPTCMAYPQAMAAVALLRELFGRVVEPDGGERQAGEMKP